MKQILSLVLAILMCAFALVSCSEEGDDGVPDGMARVRSAHLDLQLFYPENWTVSENDTHIRLVSAEQNSLEKQMAASDVTDGAAVLPSNIGNVSVHRIREGVEDLKAYAEGEWRESFSDSFVFEPEVDEHKLGQDPTYTAKYHFASKEGVVLYRFSQTLVLHKGSVYAILFTATPELFDILTTSVSDIRKSLLFEDVSDEENTPLSVAADETVAEDADKIPTKEGLLALTNKGVPFILYYPENASFQVWKNTGFLAIRAEDGASVSVVRGDAYAAQIQNPTDYLDRQYYPSFDALYGSHVELSREVVEHEGAYVVKAVFQATVEGEEFTFLQTLYMRQGYLYNLLYTAKSADYQTHLPAVETMIREFAFKA